MGIAYIGYAMTGAASAILGAFIVHQLADAPIIYKIIIGGADLLQAHVVWVRDHGQVVLVDRGLVPKHRLIAESDRVEVVPLGCALELRAEFGVSRHLHG